MSDRHHFQRETDVSRETLEQLDTYAALLEKWNPRINLVSRATLRDLWHRHFLDSAQLADLIPSGPTIWADIGSGGGFPGLIVALIRPDTEMTLVESDQRKAAFLNTVIRATNAPAKVISRRIEDAAPLNADVISARALAPLKDLLSLAHQHLKPTGTAIFPKGATHAAETKEALEQWTYRCETTPSKTDPDAVLLKIAEIQRAH